MEEALHQAAMLTCQSLLSALIEERQHNAILQEEITRLRSTSSASEGESLKSLKDLMRELAIEDESCVFVVRKINRLRSEASVMLADHFRKFGKVCKVLLLPWRRPRESGRPRPSSLGFVLMGDRQGAARILSTSQHVIAGFPIPVEPYHRDSL